MASGTTCGTLVFNREGELLLCHVTGTGHWDIPKGMQDPGETPRQAAVRELLEETGLRVEEERLDDLGRFPYRPEKDLHLFRAGAPFEVDLLERLVCTSHFPHHRSGAMTPEVDGFRWARRDEITSLCWPRMAQRLLTVAWPLPAA